MQQIQAFADSSPNATMLAESQFNNLTLLGMMRANERAYRDKVIQRNAAFLAALAYPGQEAFQPRPAAPLAPRDAPAAPAKPQSPSQAPPPKQEVPVALAEELPSMRQESVPLTHDEVQWLKAVAARQCHSSISGVVRRLVDWANGEVPARKKHIFLVVRCRRCSAGAMGGVKGDHEIELPSIQWQWLEGVRDRCRHASLGKTVRIIVDFYMLLCERDADFEGKVLRAGSACKTSRHKENVAPSAPEAASR